MTTTLWRASILLAAAGAVSAQSSISGHVIGWANNNTPLAVCSSVYTQNVDGNCQPTVFQGSSLCTAQSSFAGGAAYDPRHQAAWVSNGNEIALHDLATKSIFCRFKATLHGTTNVVTGLALSDSRRELYQLEMGNQVLIISSYDVTAACSPTHKGNACRAPLTGTSAASMGLAFDEGRDLLYYTTSISGFAGWANWIHVAHAAAPCTAIQSLVTNYCGGRPGSPLSGLGYDACTQRLYVTDGSGIRTLRMTDPLNGVFTDLTGAGACCTFDGTGIWAGLAVVPSWKKSSVGTSCLDAPCGSCPAMQLDLVGGDASLGNRDFGFVASGAPGGSLGMFYVAIGKCTSGIQIPGLCGPIYTPITPLGPILVGGFSMGGAVGQCTGKSTVVTGIPSDPAFCTTTFCAQWLVLCPTGGLWSGLTNAVGFTIGG